MLTSFQLLDVFSSQLHCGKTHMLANPPPPTPLEAIGLG